MVSTGNEASSSSVSASSYINMKNLYFAFAFCAIAGCSPTWTDHTGLTIDTSSGSVHGMIDEANPDVRQFLGIPFAQPPLNELRFAPPLPIDSPATDTIEATELPPSCMQWLGTGASVYTRNVLEFNLQGLNETGNIDEDCLTLSVWAPSKVQGPLPVLIFVYGGGFNTGGQDVPYQIPTQWVQRSQDHIVVSFNYRLNIFGYPNAAEASQNVGLLDQRLAVEWVRDNIAAFGGDPDHMVLWGQSAGASSVTYYVYSYPDDPIISGFVTDSGTARDTTTIPDTSNFTFVAQALGCDGSTDELACMRSLDASTINDFLANYSNTQTQPSLSFRPRPDNMTVPSNFTDRAQNSQLPSISGIIGTNAQDGVPFAPYTYNVSGPNLAAAETARLNTFFCPSTYHIELRQQSPQGLDTFSYFYGGNFSNISPVPWLGAFHSGELPLLMGTHGNYRGESTEFEMQTSVAMQDAWVAFARGGVEGLEETGWMRYQTPGQHVVRNFGNATLGVAAADISVGWSEERCDGQDAKQS